MFMEFCHFNSQILAWSKKIDTNLNHTLFLIFNPFTSFKYILSRKNNFLKQNSITRSISLFELLHAFEMQSV